MSVIYTTPQVVERLNKCNKGDVGFLYGVPDMEEGHIILDLSMRDKEDDGEDEDVSNPFLPVGLTPIGVFFSGEEDHPPFNEMEQEISKLPEAFLETNDPVIVVHKGEGDLQGYVNSSVLKEAPLQVRESYKDKITQLRVRGSLSVISRYDIHDITRSFMHVLNKVTCPYGCFRLRNSDVLFLHTWKEGKPSLSSGWSVSSSDFLSGRGEGEEECVVTNVDNYQKKNVLSLWDYIKEEDDDDEDDGFGPTAPQPKKKIKKVLPEAMNFNLLMKMSGEAYVVRTYDCSPIVKEDTAAKKCLRIKLPIDSVGIVSNKTKIVDVMEILKGCVQRQIHQMGKAVIAEFKIKGSVSSPEVFHFKTPILGEHLVSIVYTKSNPCSAFVTFRKHIHEKLLLPLDKPLFRRMNKYVFEEDQSKSGPLLNPHESLKSPGIGKTYLVKGRYAYYHYMQEAFDDDGWGCAYRSLQTLISWFRFQGYSEKKVPSHAQIQKYLISIGDKESSFLNSKQWIGSMEVGFVLETALGVQSRFISVSSGEEMPAKGRDLAHHFETNGTPVMIGGGVLAHTILGVDWNENTGDIKWLILDPHYTGSDWTKVGRPNLSTIQGKGWCAWKGPDFWKKSAFYNMCMPIPSVQL